MTRILFVFSCLAIASATPARAQSADDARAVAVRPFVVFTGETFAAKTSFDAIFGQHSGPFWGAGAEVVVKRHVFVDVTVSRFRRDGQRAVIFGGQAYGLGLPLTATLTPVEVTAGYRFTQFWSRVVPYAGGGVGSYAYTETSPSSASATENVDTSHAGLVVLGGTEVRLHRWIRVSGDVQYTRVRGILGQGGVSQQAGESDLGGVALRARVLVGR